MIKFVDNFLDKITMYRLVLYYLLFLVLVGAIFSIFGILPYKFAGFAISVFLITLSCWVTNKIFSKTFRVPVNFESVYISALILSLIITPAKTLQELMFLIWVGVLAMASKYIFAIGNKHIFNPVAFSVALCAIAINQSASWWVGTAPMLPFVLAGGLLVARKTRRSDLIIAFISAAIATILGASVLKGANILTTLQKSILDSPLLFFAFVMLTEPLTMPPTKILQRYYGAFVGFLFAPQIHFGPIFTTPEVTLLIGNMFTYLVSPKNRLLLKLSRRVRVAQDTYDYFFKSDKKIQYVPGQYLEWTLPQKKIDSRGNRRYFTIASSPTEEDLKIGVKFYQNSSSFKKTLVSMNINSEILASQLAGEFTLPKDPNKKLVFLAGGIGITPFLSMIKYLLDTRQSRPIVLLYSNKVASDIAYADIFSQARQELGIKTVYTLTDNATANWQGNVGAIDKKLITEQVPDYKDRLFYLSGPRSMVTAFEAILSKMAVKRSQIKTDFFPGFA